MIFVYRRNFLDFNYILFKGMKWSSKKRECNQIEMLAERLVEKIRKEVDFEKYDTKQERK